MQRGALRLHADLGAGAGRQVAAGTAGGQEIATARLRVLTANLLKGRVDPVRLKGLVAALEVDAAAVQEASRPQADALHAVLPNGCVDAMPAGSGVGLALARPAPVRRVTLPPRDGMSAVLMPVGGLRPVEILAVHMVAPHTPPVWASLVTRRRQARALEAYGATVRADHRIVLGDLNATPAWPLYRALVASGLADAARAVAAARGTRPAPTWGPWPGSPRLLRIDHVLFRGLEAVDCRVIALPGGDHAALVVDLAVPGGCCAS